jgi:plastocyanin
MRFLAAFALLPATVYGATMNVVVAPSGSVIFSPDTVSANPGDVIVFTFSSNHSFTETMPTSPCNQVVAGGIDSGFPLAAAGATGPVTYNITVNNTDPMYFKCNQMIPENHCALGMVFGLNLPLSGNASFATFQSNAMASSTTTGAPASTTSCTTTSSQPMGYSYVACTNSAAKLGSGAGLFAVALAAVAHLLF